jgi:hypothetical protein
LAPDCQWRFQRGPVSGELKPGCCGHGPERFTNRIDDPHCGVWIVPGDERPNVPKFALDAWSKNEVGG